MVVDCSNSLRKAEIYSQFCQPRSFTEPIEGAQIKVPVYFSILFLNYVRENKDIIR